ncbi:MAG: AMP-binding protein [Candidatus Moduliflexus flocculans]|nr:AMP-binding protein [Candidatus Moduliflexus flocculans]
MAPWRRLVDKFATGLSSLGVKKGDKVMLYISNCPQWLIANYAINRIGAITVPVSPSIQPLKLNT